MATNALPAALGREPPVATPRATAFRRLAYCALIGLILAGLPSASGTAVPVAGPQDTSGRAAAAQRFSFVGKTGAAGGPVMLAGDPALLANRQRAIDGKLERVAPFRFAGSAADLGNAVDCLAAAAYYEAGDDPDGQAAVAQVVLNRLRHPAYPKSVCGVVLQGSQRDTGCQFTFTCDGSLARRPGRSAWSRARATAVSALAGHVDARVGSATHYHADYVLPYWAPTLRKVATIGRHVFYRWSGSWGGSAVLHDPAPGQEHLAGLAAAVNGSEGSPELALAAIGPGAPGSATPVSEAPVAPPIPGATILTLADQGLAPGRWAVNAMNACGARPECLVIAYTDADELQRNRLSAPANRETPVFLFVREASSGAEMALWDCSRIQRPSATQCLPGERQALARLLRNRG